MRPPTQEKKTKQYTVCRTRRGTMGDKRRQDPAEGGHAIQQRETASGSMGDNGSQDPREGGHTIQHRHTCGETMGETGR